MQFLDRYHPAYGIAALRIMAGIILVQAGYAKLFVMGLAGMTRFFGNIGIPAPEAMVPLLVAFELVGGVLLLLGAFSRWIGLCMIVEFLVAGFLASLPSQMGWGAARMDFLMAACGLTFFLAGSGALSVDELLLRRRAGQHRRARSVV